MKIVKILLLINFFLFSNVSFTQISYVDIVTPGVITLGGGMLKIEQESTQDKLEDIKKQQALINIALNTANDAQKKVREGLTTVQGVVKNGMKIKRIKKNIVKIRRDIQAISSFLSADAEYSVLVGFRTNDIVTQAIEIGLDAERIVSADDFNWVDQGDREVLLKDIEIKTRVLHYALSTTYRKLKRAKRVGFLNSINPFYDKIGKDIDLINSIIHDSGKIGI